MGKGFVFDLLFGIFLLFLIALFIIIMAFGNQLVMGAFGNSTAMGNATASKLNTYMTNTFNTFNYGFLFAVVGLFFSVGILAYFIHLHPIFFPFIIIVIAIAVFVSFFLSNAYWSFVNSSSAFLALAEQFWVVTWFMKNLPFVTFIFGVFVSILTYVGK